MNTVTAHTLPVELGDGPFAVTTDGVSKEYGKVRALDGLSLRVPEGAVYVLVGPNGAGKTTLLGTLLGTVRRGAGSIDVLGFDPEKQGVEVRARVGYVPEHHRLGYSWATVGRLIEHYRTLYPTWDTKYSDRLVDAFEIDVSKKCRALSKGQRRRVQILLALSHRPRVLVLDEPTDGLDHVIREVVLSILVEHLADSPTTALISTHRAYEIERIVDHVGVLRGGSLLGQMPTNELRGKLRRYWADVPEGFDSTLEPAGRVIRRAGGTRDVEWTVWGEEDRIVEGFAQAGATVRDVSPLNLDDAATALLSHRGG